jgi:hypothetical protein
VAKVVTVVAVIVVAIITVAIADRNTVKRVAARCPLCRRPPETAFDAGVNNMPR